MPTPRELGFAMPPEWAPHARCWMAWPCRPELWGRHMAAARQSYAEVARAIARFEPVTMIVDPELLAEAQAHCGPGITLLALEHDDSWTRDTAPTFVVDRAGHLAGIDWRFDGYGGASPEVQADARLAEEICARLDIARFAAPVVLEGGGLHVDGAGTALVCAGSVLDPRRNPGLSRRAANRVLEDYLGVRKVIWLERGFVDDETAGHVDNLACFAAPGVVLALAASDPEDANYEALGDNCARLRRERDATGRPLEVIPIEQPAARHRPGGGRLTTSYLNFYVANGGLVVPRFADPMDQAAGRAIVRAFPGRALVQVDGSRLVLGGGGIHCITQQQPAARVGD